MLKNMRQFKASDDVDALKNLAEEFIDIVNVHHPLLEFICDEIVNLIISLEKMNDKIQEVILKSKTKRDLYE